MGGILGSNGRGWVGCWGYWEGMDGILGVLGDVDGILEDTGE